MNAADRAPDGSMAMECAAASFIQIGIARHAPFLSLSRPLRALLCRCVRAGRASVGLRDRLPLAGAQRVGVGGGRLRLSRSLIDNRLTKGIIIDGCRRRYRTRRRGLEVRVEIILSGGRGVRKQECRVNEEEEGLPKRPH